MKNIMRKSALFIMSLILVVTMIATPAQVSAAKKVSINKKSIYMCLKNTYTLKLNNNKKTVKWSSSKKSVVSVTSKGKITTRKAGKATITAKVGKKKYTCKVTVAGSKLNQTTKRLSAGSYTRMSVTKNSKKVKWSTSNKKVATINSAGKVVAVNSGTATIKASIASGYLTCKVTVTKPGHKWSAAKVTLQPTCTVAGTKESTCSHCNDVKTETVAALGHTYKSGVCTRCGAEQSKAGSKQVIASATADKVSLALYGIGAKTDGKVKVVQVKANEYVAGDSIHGLSKNEVKGTVVGYYQGGSDQKITFNRYTKNGYDGIYCKYYVVANSKIVKGPIYVNNIAAARNTKDVTTKSKKGIFGESGTEPIQHAKDLGVSHTALNVNLSTLVLAKEKEVDGKVVSNNLSAYGYYTFKSNGKTYYFNKKTVDNLDTQIKGFTDADISISLGVVASRTDKWSQYPYFLTYGKDPASKGSFMGINTSNSYGRDYWIAAVEFLADRYTRENYQYGHISSMVLGNEMDLAHAYNNITNNRESLDIYMEEYSRLLRMANNALAKYCDDMSVSMSLSHFWSKARVDVEANQSHNTYAPKEMIEWMNKKSKEEGDFNWGISPHVYGSSLAGSTLAEHDTIIARPMGMNGDYKTTTYLTFSNLEILQQYLEQSSLKVNGQTRPVYLNEQGCSSYMNTTSDLNKQSVYLASSYYKIAHMDCIKAYNYYRLIDHEQEVAQGACLGLLNPDGTKKPAYKVYKYIDTQYTYKAADQYLPAFEYVDKNGTTRNVANGSLSTWKDTMNLFDTTFDWDRQWDDSKIIKRTADKVNEWEDAVDLSGVKFLDRNFYNDGTEHELLITGDLPTGVTATYENNKRTAEGSNEATVKFFKDGSQIGTRTATITVTNCATNKVIYENGEKIFVTAKTDSVSDWVAIYKKGETPGSSTPSIYWYTVRDGGRFSGGSYSIKETGELNTIRDDLKDLPAGEYSVFLLKDGGYDIITKQDITILPAGESSGTPNLSDVIFADTEVSETGSEQKLEITGTLPAGVTVSYENNTRTAIGSTMAKATFMKDGKVIEVRYATLKVKVAAEFALTTDKAVYNEGDSIMVTATAKPDSWVAIYLETDNPNVDQSIYWYYTSKEGHISGDTYKINQENVGFYLNAERASLRDLPAGDYKVILFKDGGYDVAETVHIRIQ